MKEKFFLIITAIFFSCNEKENPVPEVFTDFSVSLNSAEFKNLQSPGGYVYVKGGNQGIFLYNFNNSTFYAFDRACTFGSNHSPLVFDEKTKCLYHSDTVENCSSKFNVLLHGAVVSGSAEFPLREYKVTSYGSGNLKITNY